MTIVNNVVYEKGDYWVYWHDSGFYRLYKNTDSTHSVCISTIHYENNRREALKRIKNECDRRFLNERNN